MQGCRIWKISCWWIPAFPNYVAKRDEDTASLLIPHPKKFQWERAEEVPCRCLHHRKQKNLLWSVYSMVSCFKSFNQICWKQNVNTYLLDIFQIIENHIHAGKEQTVMTSSNGSIFRVPGPLCGEFTGLQWIPLTKANDAELWCFLWSAPEQTVE